MKVRKRLLWLALSLCVCLSLLFSSAAVSVSAASMPDGIPSNTINVNRSDLMDSTKAVWLYSWDDVTKQYYGSQRDVIWESVENTPDGASFSGVRYTIDGRQYQLKSLNNVYDISKLATISNKDAFDHFFGMFVKIYYPATYSMNIFKSLTVYPVYTDIDGNSKGDTLHGLKIEPEHISSITVNGEPWYCVSYNLWTGANYIGVPYHWIPDNYYLSGFGFNFEVGAGNYSNTNTDDWYIPSGTKVYFSEIECKSFLSSDATTNAIENQTERLESSIIDAAKQIMDVLGDVASEIKDATEKQTEEHRGMFERLGDRISGFFDNLLSGILDGLKGLIIPDDGYFDKYFSDWDAWMTDHFGALYYPFDLILDVLNRFLTLEVPETPSITFPTLQVGETVLLESQTYTFFGEDSLPALNGLYQTYRMVVTAIFVFALANLAWRKLNSIMGGGE